MATVQPASTPKHLWVVGILSLLWNSYGAFDYTMSHIGGLAYFESAGLDQAAFDWFHAMPNWAIAAWAVGVWISLLGSVLLLLRSRHAATAFAVSFVGALISFGYQFTSDRPASLEGTVATIVPIVIMILIVAQGYYARRQAAAGVLR